MRVTPPLAHEASLQVFDDQVRACLEQVGGLPLTPTAWAQATLGIKLGGLGLRLAALHAPEACLASVARLETSCFSLDANYRTSSPASLQHCVCTMAAA